MNMCYQTTSMELVNLIFVVGISAGSKAFLFDVKTDCLVSPWSEWIDIPGLAAPVRERSILRHDSRGGFPCPPVHALRQVKVLPKSITTTPIPDHQQKIFQQLQVVNKTAHSIVHNFLRRSVTVQPVAGGNREKGHFRDLLIVLDSSGSIGSENYAKTKRSLSELLKTLCPDPDPFGLHLHHAAMIVYSGRAEVEFNFMSYYNTLSIQTAITKAPYLDGITCTTNAFETAFDLLSTQNGMRSSDNIDKEVLILTDGQSNCGGDVYMAAAKLRQKARVFALLIGQATEKGLEEMTSYVSAPVQDHLFALENYQEFDSLVELLQKQSQMIPCVPLDIPEQ